jgi:hypothetical protein
VSPPSRATGMGGMTERRSAVGASSYSGVAGKAGQRAMACTAPAMERVGDTGR